LERCGLQSQQGLEHPRRWTLRSYIVGSVGSADACAEVRGLVVAEKQRPIVLDNMHVSDTTVANKPLYTALFEP
jgi:hypothetical protein